MTRVFAITVIWQATPVHPPLIDAVLGFAGDWIRISSHVWFVKTAKGAGEVQELIRKHLNDGDSFLVLPVDQVWDAGGYAPQWIWNWIRDLPPPAPPLPPPA